MIKDFFSSPLQIYEANHLELQELQEESPTSKNGSYLDQNSNTLPVRNQKFMSLPYQKQSIILSLLPAHFKEELNSLRAPEYLKVKNTQDHFYGETSKIEKNKSFLRHDTKVAHGLSEIFFENGAYLIGYFDKGILEQEFLFVLENGSYIKAKPKTKVPKRSMSGFITDDSDDLASEDDSEQDENRISESDIRVNLQDHKEKDLFSNLESQITFNGTYYKGTLKKGELNGLVLQKGKDYEFQGHFINGERKRGKLVSLNGFSYEGTFKNNKFDGLGTLRTNEGVYSGQFKSGLKDGQGEFIWNDGSSYKGDFQKDLRHGKGFYKSKEGSFKGDWRNDQIQGSGYLIIGNQGVGGCWSKDKNYQMPQKYY